MSSHCLEVISEILVELDKEYAEFQRLYKKFYGTVDNDTKAIYIMKKELCEEIKKRLILKEKV